MVRTSTRATSAQPPNNAGCSGSTFAVKEALMGSPPYAEVKAWRAKNSTKVAAQARRYRKRHPDKIAKIKRCYRKRGGSALRKREAEQAQTRRKSNPKAQRLRELRFRRRKRKHQVKLAGRPRPKRCEKCSKRARVVFDHCHRTNMFRGWLCDRCNLVLGLAKDNPELLRTLAAHLETSHGSSHHKTA
jgi:hypothetical protein